MGKEQKIASTSEIEPGALLGVVASGEQILLANVGGRVHAVSDICTHAGCNLSEGTLDGDVVECPCHGGRFNITTGEVTQAPPEESLKTYVVHIRGSDVFVEMD